MFETEVCEKTVSLPRAILFGADGACVDIGTGSLIGFVALFIAAVVALKLFGRALFDRFVVRPAGDKLAARRSGSAEPSTPPR
ncbi:MAG: hypothetical protein KDE00_11940 [Rhodobacteraceae bacterium]|nr:hypothetical protein [Paracoccaceae bacterium]